MTLSSKALALNSAYQSSRSALELSMARLSTGDKFAKLDKSDPPMADLAISERFRSQLRAGNASTTNFVSNQQMISTSYEYLESVQAIVLRMTELAAGAVDPLKTTSNRQALNLEFQMLKSEITDITRNALFNGNQLVGRDVVASFDNTEGKISFWQPGGNDEFNIERDFSASALDANGTAILFDGDNDFTMSRDGKSLFYLASDNSLRRYDLASNTVSVGGGMAAEDKLFVDEEGKLFINNSGTLFSIDSGSLASTSVLVGLAAGVRFAVSDDQVTYKTAGSDINRYNIDTATTTTLISAGTLTTEWASTSIAGQVNHSISPTGRFLTDETTAGVIRVIDTRSSDPEADLRFLTVATGANAGQQMYNMRINESADRIYYQDLISNNISYATLTLNAEDEVRLGIGETIVQGVTTNAFTGLSLGGSSPQSNYSFAAGLGSINIYEYESADVSLYQLGLLDSRVDTITDADAAISELEDAMDTVSGWRSVMSSKAQTFNFANEALQGSMAILAEAEDRIRNVSVAEEISILSVAQAKNAAAIQILGRFNQLSQNVLALLS